MDDRQPRIPDPVDDRGALLGALARAADGDFDEDLTISLRVAGGAPEQRYRFDFKSRRGNIDICTLDCEMTQRHGAVHELTEVDAKIMASLSRTILRSGLLSLDEKPPRFLPDTLVGIIEVTIGGVTHRTYFAADPDQAAVQDRTPPEAVIRTADAIYEAAGNFLGIDNARP